VILSHAAFFWERQVRRCDWCFLKASTLPLYTRLVYRTILLAIILFPLGFRKEFSWFFKVFCNKSMCSYGEGYKLYDAICICSFMKRQIKPKELGLKSNTVACFWDIFFLGLYIILATNRHTIESF
jgi:hypothetical protein